MSSDAAATLRLANASLRAWMVRLRAEPSSLSPIEAKDLKDLLAELQRASGCLRIGTAGVLPDPALTNEILEYRANLETLAKVLPSVQGRLLAERARLQNTQSQLAARNAWAEASKRTF
jgi:hypothetical protein